MHFSARTGSMRSMKNIGNYSNERLKIFTREGPQRLFITMTVKKLEGICRVEGRFSVYKKGSTSIFNNIQMASIEKRKQLE